MLGTANTGNMKKSYKPINFETFWIKPNQGVATKSTAKNGLTLNGETEGSKIYPTRLESVVQIYMDAMLGRPIMIGYKFKDGTEDFAVSSPVEISDEEKGQISQCINELSDSIQSETSKK